MATDASRETPETKAWRWAQHPACAPLSRKIFRKWLARVGAERYEEDGTLLFMELLTNAIRLPANDGLIPTRWLLYGDRLRVEVDDCSTEGLVASDPGPYAERGRGLILVHLIADKYGVNDRVFNDGQGNYLPGKTVWFELYKQGLLTTP